MVMVLLIAMVSMAFVGSAAAATYYVNPGDSIQATINGAADGDTIVLTGGEYTENVVVNKSVAMISAGLYAYLHTEGWADGEYWWFGTWHDAYNYAWDYTFEYDEAVTVNAADPKQSVFTVESDDVLICNINLDYSGAGSYAWDFYFFNTHHDGYVEWEYLIYDHPMMITGAYKSDAAGILVDGADKTTLMNLDIFENDNGIVLNGATNTYIEDVEMNGNCKEGLLATGCEGIVVYDCVVVDSGKRGIEIEDSADVELDTVLVLNSNKNGIECTNVDGLTMTYVCVEDGAKHGVDLDDCTDIDMTYMYIAGNGRSGLTMNDCDGTTVADSEIAFNTDYGLKTHNVFNVAFVNNDIHDNGQDEKHFNSA